MSDSQASSSSSIRDATRQTCGTHCAICLVGLPRGSAYLLDQASRGADQVRINLYDKFALNIHAGADALGLLTSDFRRSSAENGHLCAYSPLRSSEYNAANEAIQYVLHVICSISLQITSKLCPSLPVLQYINNYLNDPQLEAEPLPLHQVCIYLITTN